MENVKCPVCGSIVSKGKFCSECGSLLEDAVVTDEKPKKPMTSFMPLNGSFVEQKENDNTTVSDKGLTLLVDCCQKTVATVGGDGYTELVLYQRSEDEYELHYYRKYQYEAYETHYAYKASKEIVDEVYAYLREANLEKNNGKGNGLCGGDYVVKYLLDGEMHRVSLSTMNNYDSAALYKVGSIIGACQKEENKL